MELQNFDELCREMEALDENGIIEILHKQGDIRKSIIALLDLGYILDNHEMTAVGEYPFLVGTKNHKQLNKLNQTLQQQFAGASSQ